MTYPPQPGQWNPGAPPPGSPPPGYYPPPGWTPQPPPKQGGGLKWLLIGVAVLLVIAITVGATLFFTRDGSGSGGTTTTAAPSVGDMASANDTGPVSIITSEPTCQSWTTIHNTLSNVESNGWGDRDPLSESSSWSPQVRAQYEAVTTAIRSAADRAVVLAKQTPHRVMREMYEQFIAYGRAYADSLSSYQPKDDLLSLVNVNVDSSLAGVCGAIDFGGIATRASTVSAAPPPATPPTIGDVSSPEQFVVRPTSSCTAWVKATAQFENDIKDWERLDSGIAASDWTPEQRRFQETGTRAMDVYATTMENAARGERGIFQDFAYLASMYLKVYVASSASYMPSDSWISVPGLRLNNTIAAACNAAVG